MSAHSTPYAESADPFGVFLFHAGAEDDFNHSRDVAHTMSVYTKTSLNQVVATALLHWGRVETDGLSSGDRSKSILGHTKAGLLREVRPQLDDYAVMTVDALNERPHATLGYPVRDPVQMMAFLSQTVTEELTRLRDSGAHIPNYLARVDEWMGKHGWKEAGEKGITAMELK